ncbi:nitroreductase [Pandoraea cepalis]|uniref:Nitroreductase n=1 Tax=Pandoraea cepalis TaxID=2508294 RepID=A0AAW7MNJ9_9BURK|nr:nitroreductase family protein [Pandoraea cepalis]MDN4574136.1 nitroreductase [Pandoraea cepalis]MDN4579639.1 nitroreductase [Pandoraea cepalis]
MNEAKLPAYAVVRNASPVPLASESLPVIVLPPPSFEGGASLMMSLARRKSVRDFAPTALSRQQLGDLLWAADGVNRADTGGRTAPSAHGVNEIDVYAALPEGVYRYDPASHQLHLKHAVDARNLTGYQDFVGQAPLDLVYVVNHARADQFPQSQRDTFAGIAVGAIAQNVSLYCASAGLACVVRGWLNHRMLANAMSLNEDEIPVLAQTVGHPMVAG